ncbi:MAG: FAD-dependent oxidoreductase [Nitrospinota bacterium]|jgi:NADPH-dependent glutamate synthase beta subunit-like oxidoreductase/ferredoxin|nr:FAD-dependent oxidoreductase [Nitrospinota bacterium]MDP7580615.1 FAD-dependent oxidoreductase [Nitrospinota bacterium]HJN02211.1 FAD-dependent oxidoreductase [Nitrospinota bacterium]
MVQSQTKDRYHTVVPDIDYFEKQIKCQYACPVNTPSGHYVTAISEGEFDKAAVLARGPNPFAQICGRVCAAPCQQACRRGSLDENIQIRMLKRSAMLYETENTKKQIQTGDKVAIVGSGPAGMAAADYLGRRGYRVTILEMLDKLAGMFAGMLVAGVPRYRLTNEIISKDIDPILNLGVEVRTGVKVGHDVTIADLKKEGFKAVILAIGAQLSRRIPLDGLELPGVLQGVEVMRNINMGKRIALGKKVVVIGGGNVAMDVARSMVRLGREVHLTCLEAMKGSTDGSDLREEMPADQVEVDEGTEEGITIHCSRGPKKVIEENGRVLGLLTIGVKKVFDENGRFNPAFMEGTTSLIEADNVILSVGQMSDASFLDTAKGFRVTRFGTIEVEQDTLFTFVPGVYAAGDFVSGPRTAIEAIAQGKAAGQSVDEFLRGVERKPIYKKAKMTVVPKRNWHVNYTHITQQRMPILDAENRKKSLKEVEIGFSEEMAMKEGSRCLQCMVNPIFDGSKCILCGGCVDVCPHYCLKIVPVGLLEGDETLRKVVFNHYGISLEDFQTSEYKKKLPDGGSVMLKDEDKCIRCGLCDTRCPTGAVTMELLKVESQTEGYSAVI